MVSRRAQQAGDRPSPRHKRSPALRVCLIVPGISRGFFVGAGMRCWPATHACPGPLCLPLPGRRDIVRCQADWSGRLLVVFQGERYAAKRQADAGRFEAGENLGENVAGRETFLEKGSPSPCPTLPKTFAGGPAAAEPAQRWESPRKEGVMSWHGKKLNLWLSGVETCGRESRGRTGRSHRGMPPCRASPSYLCGGTSQVPREGTASRGQMELHQKAWRCEGQGA